MSAEEQFTRILQLLEAQGKRLDRIDQRLGHMDQRFERMDQYVLEFRNEVARRLDLLENSLRLMSSAVFSIETRIQPFTKGMLEYGVIASQIALEQGRLKTGHSDLAERVAKLEELVASLIKPAA
jgi:hypothetical protein